MPFNRLKNSPLKLIMIIVIIELIIEKSNVQIMPIQHSGWLGTNLFFKKV